ncbi:MAG: hypothetical protein R3E97_09125 [Candidatus Eisenbacteria bacterium]
MRPIATRLSVGLLVLASLGGAATSSTARIRFTGVDGTALAGVASAEENIWFSSSTHRDWQKATGAGEGRTYTTVLATSSGYFLVAADDGTVWRSNATNGNAYTLRATVSSTIRDFVEIGGSVFAVGDGAWVGKNGDRTGGSWETIDLGIPAANDLFAVAANTTGAGSMVAVGDHGTLLRATVFGASWQSVFIDESRALRGLVVDPFGNYLAVGDGGAAWRGTADGMTWSPIDLGTTADLHAVDIVGQATVAVGSSETILYSSAGFANWTSLTAPSLDGVSSYDLLAVAGTGTPDWVAMGTERAALYSQIGLSWFGSDVTPIQRESWGRIKSLFAQ